MTCLILISLIFEQMVSQIYPTELQLNKAYSSDTEAPFLDMNLSINYGIVSSKFYDKQDDFNFEKVNFPFFADNVPPSHGVYISQLIRFARVCSNVNGFNNRNKVFTSKFLKQGSRAVDFVGLFLLFITDNQGGLLSTMLVWKLFCSRAYQSLCFMVIWFVDLKELLEGLVLVINLKR